MGEALFAMGKLDEALSNVKTGIDIIERSGQTIPSEPPSLELALTVKISARAYELLGWVFYERDELEKADEAFGQAAELAGQAVISLGTDQGSKQREESFVVYRDQLTVKRGLVLLALGKPQEANRCLTGRGALGIWVAAKGLAPPKKREAQVIAVLDGSPAQKAGLKPGDLIVGAVGEGEEDWYPRCFPSHHAGLENVTSGKQVTLSLRRGLRTEEQVVHLDISR